MRRAVVLALVALAAGCDSFEPASLVRELRILAITADPPELGSGERGVLHPHIADLRDPGDMAQAPIEYEWALCTKRPRVGVQIDDACSDADMAEFLTPLPTLPDGGTEVTMPMLTFESFGLPDSSGGFYLPVRLRMRSGDRHITAFHRLRWNAGLQTPNHNPSLTRIMLIPTPDDGELPDLGGPYADAEPRTLVDGVPLDVPRGGKLRLRVEAAPGSQEDYVTVVGDPRELKTMTVTEQVRFFWYTSAGKMDHDVTGVERPDMVLDTTEYADPLDRRDGLVDVWVVAREERGGIDLIHRYLRVR